MSILNMLKLLFMHSNCKKKDIQKHIEHNYTKNQQPKVVESSCQLQTEEKTALPPIGISEIRVPQRQGAEPQFMTACARKRPSNTFEAYFKNGILYKVIPRDHKISLYENRQIAYDAQYIVSDNVKYNLKDPESILRIKIPNFKDNMSESTTFDLSYILKMRASSEEEPNLAVPLAYKVVNMMIASPIAWHKKDYYQVIKQLWLIGEINFADCLLAELEERKVFIEPVKNANFSDYYNVDSPYFRSDLIESNATTCVCHECAKYVKRWFSEFGYNKKYPKLPDYFKEHNTEHKYCCISFHPVLDDVSVPAWDYADDFVKFCNRPYTDDRTDKQKQRFEEYKIDRMQREKADEKYCSRDFWINEYYKHLEYQHIVDLLGDKAPKNYSGYRRMKKNNTNNYQKILKLAEDNNICILKE